MGIGPVPAIEALLKASGISQQDIDLFDVRRHYCFVLPARQPCCAQKVLYSVVSMSVFYFHKCTQSDVPLPDCNISNALIKLQ